MLRCAMRLFGPVAPVCEGPVPIPSAFRHASTFERVIGFKCGTGGTGDVNYLRKMLGVVLLADKRHSSSVERSISTSALPNSKMPSLLAAA